MGKRVERAIDVFLDAINKGTLIKGDCTACAVGNLVAHGMGGIISLDSYCDATSNCNNDAWGLLFATGSDGQNICPEYLAYKRVIENIEATEFDWEELAQIEFAFETNAKIDCKEYNRHTKEQIRADQINGLNAVVKVMLGFSNDKATSVDEVFTSKAILI